MSSVSSIGGNGVDVTKLLQAGTTQQIARRQGPANEGGASRGEPPADFGSKFGEALTAAGVSEEDAATIQEKIKSAIAAALQSQDAAGEGRDAAKQAIDGVLEKQGIDSQKSPLYCWRLA